MGWYRLSPRPSRYSLSSLPPSPCSPPFSPRVGRDRCPCLKGLYRGQDGGDEAAVCKSQIPCQNIWRLSFQ